MPYNYGINKRQFSSPETTDSGEDGPSTTQSLTTAGPTITAVPTATATVTTTVIDKSSEASNSDISNMSGSTNILVVSLLGSVGLIIILSGLLIIIFWLRRGEKSKGIGDRGLTQLNDVNDDGSTNDEMVTYRPSDLDDEQLPSYAEAVVRGRNSTITTQ